jgi:hypothetical protein
MSGDVAQRPAVVFLSYRRGDTQWAARGIYERLVDRYGRKNVFRDLDAIPPGARFRDYVEKKISESDIVILLIGKAWASYADEAGRRRLEQPRDPVRLEVETALRLGLPIIPVRVEGAPMPTEGDLVPSIVDLLEFNAAEVSDSRWDYDVDRLLSAINETVEGRLRPSAPEPAADREAEDKARREAEDQARRKAQEQAQREAEDQAQREAEDQARRDAEEQAQREAEDQARRKAEEQAKRDAEDQARRDAEDQARRKAQEQARHKAQEQARHKAQEQARHKAQEQAQREADDHAHRNKDEAECQIDPRPEVGQGQTVVIELSPPEAAEQIRARSWGTVRDLLHRRAVIIATTVGIGGVVFLIAYFMLTRPAATIMGHLPNDLRASCDATTDKTATCHLIDGTVVFYRLFDTAPEAEADVVNGHEVAPENSCLTSAPSVNTSVVCQYAVGPEKGLVTFGYTAKDPQSLYSSRWVSDAEPLLRGEMSTEHANPVDWTTLKNNWTRLASAS